MKVGLLKSNIKLFSNAMHVKTRMHLNVLPLRCPYEYRNQSLKIDRGAEKYDRLWNIVSNLTDTFDARYNHLSTVADINHDRLLHIVNNLTSSLDAKYNRLLNVVSNLTNTVNAKHSHLLNAADAKYDRLLNIVNDSQRIFDTKYEHFLHISSNLTNIVENSEQRTRVSINRILGQISLIQTGISRTIKCPSVIVRELHLLNEDKKRQVPRVSLT